MENVRESVRRAFVQADLRKGADDGTDHLFQETVGIGFDSQPIAFPEDRELLQMTDGIVVVGGLGLERGKIVRADQGQSCLIHGRVVKRLMDMPAIVTLNGRTFRAIQNTVFIQFALG